jgi:2-oxoglutarate dehydrogenase E1 component
VFDKNQWISKSENKMIEVTKYGRIKDTGVPLEQLKSIGTRINTLPNDLEVHPTIKKIYELRLKSIEEGKNIDFATAEALAFGSLLEEGFSVRLSGQDVERGTFSHRHCVLNDQKKDIKYYPLRQLIDPKLGHRFAVHNSHLSEYGVMGFEYGYSISDPNTLTLWEA